MKPRLWQHRPDSVSTWFNRRHAVQPSALTVSVDVCPPMGPVYGKGLLRSLQATVGASSVERPVPWAVDLSYLSIPGPGCRGTRLRRSTGPSGQRILSRSPHVHTGVNGVGKGLIEV